MYVLSNTVALITVNLYLENQYPIGFLKKAAIKTISRPALQHGLVAGLFLAAFCLLKFFINETPIDGSQFIKLHENHGVVFLLFGGIITPYIEEYFFRGNVYRLLKQEYGFQIAALISTSLFVFLHGIILVPLLLSIVTIYLYEKTESVVMCFVAHSMYNITWFLSFSYM